MSQLIGNGSQPGDWEELEVFCVGLGPRGFKRKAGRSRVNREIHARICGGLEVKFLRSTRLCTWMIFSPLARYLQHFQIIVR